MRKMWLCFFVGFLAFVGLTGCSGGEQVEEVKRTNVEVYQVQLREISEAVAVTAQLRPYQEAMIIPKLPGLKVTGLSVKAGDVIEKDGHLFELDKAIVRRQVEQAKLLYDTAKESHQYQKEQIAQLQQQSIPVISMRNMSGLSAIPDEGSLRASLAASELQLEQARIAYSSALEQLMEMDYTAPIGGVVTQVNIMENQMALQTNPAVVISDINRLKAMLSVSEGLLRELKVGQRVLLTLKDAEKIGSITMVNPVADARTNLYTVEAVFDNADRSISSGAFYRLSILKNHRDSAIAIPKEALLYDENGSFVYIEEGERAKKCYIATGIDGGDTVEVVEGLSLGDKVIVKGQQYLEEGSEVLVRGDANENN